MDFRLGTMFLFILLYTLKKKKKDGQKKNNNGGFQDIVVKKKIKNSCFPIQSERGNSDAINVVSISSRFPSDQTSQQREPLGFTFYIIKAFSKTAAAGVRYRIIIS